MGIIAILIGFFIFLLLLTKIGNYQYKLNKQKQEKWEKENIVGEFNLQHIAGHPKIKPNEKINITVYKNKISFHTNPLFEEPIKFELDLQDITRLEIKNEEQITKDVTLGRLLLLGPLAFGVKKTTKHETQYLILSYIENGVTIDCIFKNETKYQNLNEIPGIMNKMKLEKINNEQIPKTSVTI